LQREIPRDLSDTTVERAEMSLGNRSTQIYSQILIRVSDPQGRIIAEKCVGNFNQADDSVRINLEIPNSQGFGLAARVIQNKSALPQHNQYYGKGESLIPLMYGLDWINTPAFAIESERASERVM